VSEVEALRASGAALDEARVLAGLERTLSVWRDPSSEVRGRLRTEHPVFSAPVLDLGCDLGLRGWTGPALAALRARELLEPCRVPEVTAVWLAGCIPTAAFAALLYPLLAGSTVYAKPSSADPVSARLFRDSLSSADPALGEAIRIGEDTEALREADAVVVHGQDETVAAVRERVPVDRIFVGYGHRLSVAAIGSGVDAETSARPLALDVALYDGRGCLSPAYILVEDRPSGRAEALARALAAELERLATELPRGSLEAGEEAWVHDRRARAAVRDGTKLFMPDSSTAWTVLLEAPESRPAPGTLRTVPVVPIPDSEALAQWCEGLSPHVSSLGQGGWGPRASRLAEIVARAGGSRVCPLGRMQRPPIDWHHDGTGPLSALVRRVDVEGTEEEST
jgi:hypothetical protein